MKQTGNTILVTGGSTGIGRALAHRWHDAGNKVVVTGRRQDKLDEAVAGRAGMIAYPLDVDDAGAIATFAAQVATAHPDLNVLVNNAGIMRYETADQPRNLGDAEAIIATNLLGPIRMTDALLSHLLTRSDAAIVNVTSGLAFVPLPATPTYSATKAALHSYTQSLRARLAGKIEVIELVPPAVQTDLTPGQADREGYQPLDDFADEVMALFGQDETPPEILVDRVHYLRFAERDGHLNQAIAAFNAY